MTRVPGRNWLGVLLQVLLGVVVGAFLGFALWVRRNYRHPGAAALAWHVGLGAVVVGVLAGVLGDWLWLGDD